MSTVTQWWNQRSNPERFDVYTRWSLYGLSMLEPLLALWLIAVQEELRPAWAATFVILSVTHAATCIMLLRAGISVFQRGTGRDRSSRELPRVGMDARPGVGDGLCAEGAGTAGGAEERLRFSRDLHDVLGRNLCVIAVKSDLAAQLVGRGREEAAAEIDEVREIAQDSLREVREVVRGYRVPTCTPS